MLQVATDLFRDKHILESWLSPIRALPMDCVMRCTFLAGTPSGTISETAAMTARSTREYRLNRSSERY